jgi:hypothetical protein
MKQAFNPNDFFTTTTIKDIIPKFEQLKTLDFTKVSLKEELSRLNYEIISNNYTDFEFKDIAQYGNLEVDTIV